MRRLLAFAMGVVWGGGTMWFAYNYHVVRTESEWLLVSRRGNSIADTYADARTWTTEDWRERPRLTYAMIQAGHQKVLESAAADQLMDEIEQRLKRTSELLPPSSRQ